jgi:Na+/H+ antiporter NhaD/arsenite permease-like protein
MMETIFSIAVVVFLMVLIVLYAYKVGLQYELLHLQRKRKKPTNRWECWTKNANKDLRNEALMLYPLFFPVSFEEGEREQIREQKSSIKRINILIYWMLIMVLLLAVYVSKA